MGNKVSRVFEGCFPQCRKQSSDEETDPELYDVVKGGETHAEASSQSETDCKLDLEVIDIEERKVTITSDRTEAGDAIVDNTDADMQKTNKTEPDTKAYAASIIDGEGESESKTADDATIPDDKAQSTESKTFADATHNVHIKPFIPVRIVRKSAYNWGIINTWSRHLAPESDDALEIQDVFRPTVKREDLYEPQAYNVNIARPYHTEGLVENHYTYYRCSSLRRPYNVGMVRSTLDARENRARPRAARGIRTNVNQESDLTSLQNNTQND